MKCCLSVLQAPCLKANCTCLRAEEKVEKADEHHGHMFVTTNDSGARMPCCPLTSAEMADWCFFSASSVWNAPPHQCPLASIRSHTKSPHGPRSQIAPASAWFPDVSGGGMRTDMYEARTCVKSVSQNAARPHSSCMRLSGDRMAALISSFISMFPGVPKNM